MDVAIVGAGFSGTLLAYHLLRCPSFTGTIFWWEKRTARAQGIAYGTTCRAHVLNVAAQNMSALPKEPSHLLDWLQGRHSGEGHATLRDYYVPRADYATYLAELTAATFAAAGTRLRRMDDEAIDIERLAGGRQRVVSVSAPAVEVDRVALCLGQFAPTFPRVAGADCLQPNNFIENPWDTAAIAAVGKNATVATLGAGLTMVDVALQLHAQGFTGQIVAVSRHGLWPRSHVTRPSPIALAPPPRQNLSAASLLHWLRQRLAEHAALGGDWRQVLDGVRPHTVALWRALPLADQARVLRHTKALWDVHRHRVAPHVGHLLAKMRHDGRLLHHAGRLQQVAPSKAKGRLQLHWRLRHNPQLWLQDVDMLVNCTGAHSAWPKTSDALARALLARGRVAPAPLGAGLRLQHDGSVQAADGQPDRSLWAMGPARLGIDFESVAVPELREQAEALAQQLQQA